LSDFKGWNQTAHEKKLVNEFSKEVKKALKLVGFMLDDWEVDLEDRYVWVYFSAKANADVGLATVSVRRKSDGIYVTYEKMFEGLDEAARERLRKATEIFDFYEKGKWIELYENCESCELTFDD
jgi:hypothetical protein